MTNEPTYSNLYGMGKQPQDSVTLEIQDLQNLTSRVIAQLKSKGAELVELHEDGLRLVTPPLFCSLGHKLVFRLVARVTETGIVSDLELTTEVRDVEGARGEEQTVDVRLVQFDSHIWKEIHRLSERKQTQVTELFDRLKGSAEGSEK